jgi:hypothetical protein
MATDEMDALQTVPIASSAIATAKTINGKPGVKLERFFIYLLMQHVLPKGFHRTRDYGFFTRQWWSVALNQLG